MDIDVSYLEPIPDKVVHDYSYGSTCDHQCNSCRGSGGLIYGLWTIILIPLAIWFITVLVTVLLCNIGVVLLFLLAYIGLGLVLSVVAVPYCNW